MLFICSLFLQNKTFAVSVNVTLTGDNPFKKAYMTSYIRTSSRTTNSQTEKLLLSSAGPLRNMTLRVRTDVGSAEVQDLPERKIAMQNLTFCPVARNLRQKRQAFENRSPFAFQL